MLRYRSSLSQSKLHAVRSRTGWVCTTYWPGIVRPTGVSSSSARQDDDPPPQKRPKLFANYLNAREQHDAALSEVTIADLLAKYWRYRPWLWFVGFLEGQAVTVWQADTCSTAHFCCACLKCIIERVLVMGVLCCRCAHTGHVCLTSYCQSLCSCVF